VPSYSKSARKAKSSRQKNPHLFILVLLSVHDGAEHLSDGLEDELAKGTLEGLSVGSLAGGSPLLGWAVEEVLSPQATHKLFAINSELGRVHIGKLGQGETPSVKTRTEGDGSLFGVDLDVTEELVLVGGDDDVGGLDGLGEGLEGLFGFQLEFQEGTIELVDHEHGADTLTEGLTQDGFGLHADGLDAIDDDQSSVSDTEGRGDLRGEVDVTWGVNQVNQETRISIVLGELVGGQLVEEGDTGGLDGNTTILFISTGISETLFSGLSLRNDTYRGKRVRERLEARKGSRQKRELGTYRRRRSKSRSKWTFRGRRGQ